MWLQATHFICLWNSFHCCQIRVVTPVLTSPKKMPWEWNELLAMNFRIVPHAFSTCLPWAKPVLTAGDTVRRIFLGSPRNREMDNPTSLHKHMGSPGRPAGGRIVPHPDWGSHEGRLPGGGDTSTEKQMQKCVTSLENLKCDVSMKVIVMFEPRLLGNGVLQTWHAATEDSTISGGLVTLGPKTHFGRVLSDNCISASGLWTCMIYKCVCICVFTCVHVHMCVHKCVYICVCMHVHS